VSQVAAALKLVNRRRAQGTAICVELLHARNHGHQQIYYSPHVLLGGHQIEAREAKDSGAM
jgi:hypothetical protein